jgi:hypothetical protein
MGSKQGKRLLDAHSYDVRPRRFGDPPLSWTHHICIQCNNDVDRRHAPDSDRARGGPILPQRQNSLGGVDRGHALDSDLTIEEGIYYIYCHED